MTQTIHIDLDVHEALEENASSSGEGLSTMGLLSLTPSSDQPPERPRQTRSSREYILHLLGKEYKVTTCGEALKTTLLKLEKPGFFDEVYKRRIEMRRCQLVGRTREDIFPNGKPTSENNQKYHVHRLNSEWFSRSLMSVPASSIFEMLQCSSS